MSKPFTSTPSSLWDGVASDYEDFSFHRKSGFYPANSFRYEIILDYLEKQPKRRLLDAGCGPGLFTRSLQKKGWDVVACDYSSKMINVSKQKAAQEGLPDVYQVLLLQRLSELNKKFDYVVLNGVLPYVESKEEPKVFSEIKKVLKKGGVIITSHYNLYFDVFSLDQWTTTAIIDSILKPAGLSGPELKKAANKIASLLNNPQQSLDQEKTMKLEDPISYKNKLAEFGFTEFDQAYYNLFYLPAKFEKQQNYSIREKLERKLRRDSKGLLLYRTFVSFAKLVS